ALYHLPSQMILYLRQMLSADYEAAWAKLVKRAWERPKLKRGETAAPADFQPSRNWLYEDLFALADNVSERAPRFIRTYFLRQSQRWAQNDPTDPRVQNSLRQEAELVSWKLAEPFLRRMLGMDNARIEQIRALGDALADYVKNQNDRGFFRSFYAESRYGYLRNELIKANTAHVRRGHPPFLTLDNYLAVFEEGEELARVDWRLARDLVLIRLVEKLYDNGWLRANQDVVEERPAAAEGEENR
ncbi:MAG: type I-B CRISPR-associated protein Cas8b1/Cst1, partial [Candidatus Promineifilaceae bacterium]